jgi:hypothetical protein
LRNNSYLATGTAAMKNVWCLCDKRVLELVNNFPSEQEWSGDAADEARAFVGDVTGAVRTTLAAGAVTAVANLPLVAESAITAAWSTTFGEASKKLGNDVASHGKVHGLDRKLEGLINQFHQDIGPFLTEFGG